MPLGVKKAVYGNEVKVAKAPLLACLTCPLCGQLFQEATTVCECLHTFCRECIYSRLSDGETTGCPMCNVNLGCVPLEKLRADHQLDDVKAKLFPDNIRKRKSSAITSPPTHNVVKRKERSLYSLGIGSVPSNPGFATRKTKWSPSTSANGESSSSTEKSEGHDYERHGHGQVDNQLDEDLGCSTSKRNEGDSRFLADTARGDHGAPSISPPVNPGWSTPSPTLESQHGPGRLHPVQRSLVSARNGRKADQTATLGCEQEAGGGAGGEVRDFSCPLTTLAEVAGAHAARSTSCPDSEHPASVSPVVLVSTSVERSAGTVRIRDDLVNHGTEAKSKGVVHGPSSSMNGTPGVVAHRGGPNCRRSSSAWTCHKEALKRTATLKSSSSGFAGPSTVPCRRNIGGIWFALEAAENQFCSETKTHWLLGFVALDLWGGGTCFATDFKQVFPDKVLWYECVLFRLSWSDGHLLYLPTSGTMYGVVLTGMTPVTVGILPYVFGNWYHLTIYRETMTAMGLLEWDGRLPVSLVKKYLVKKLGLKNDTEVEITCRGQPVVPSLPLESVRNIWFATSSSVAGPEGKMKGRKDSSMPMDLISPHDYLMVLTYQKHRRARIC